MRLWALTILVAGCSLGQASLREDVLALYADYPDFDGSPEHNRRILEVGDYWLRAYKNPGPYIAVLREELSNRRNLPVLLIDGSERLLFMSDTPGDRAIALRALARADISQIGVIRYYSLALRLARLNEDTSQAAFHLLQWPDFQLAYGPFNFTTEEMALSLVLATDERYWADGAIERLNEKTDESAQHALLLMLWHAQTDFADNELKAFADSPKNTPALRAFAQSLLDRSLQVTDEERLHGMANTEEVLRQERRNATKLPLPDLAPFTRALIARRAATRK